MANQLRTKNFVIEMSDLRHIQSVARDNGNCSDSAALRMIIREHKALQAITPDITTATLTPKGEAVLAAEPAT